MNFIVKCSRGDLSIQQLEDMINEEEMLFWKEKAPAGGLYLYDIEY